MRISDWSSDVCSSDLTRRSPRARSPRVVEARRVGRRHGHLLPTARAPAVRRSGIGTEPWECRSVDRGSVPPAGAVMQRRFGMEAVAFSTVTPAAEIALRFGAAVLPGMVLGLDRELRGQPGGDGRARGRGQGVRYG